MSMKFKVHGVRGSVSNSSPEFDRYGGNTSWYEIEIDNEYYDNQKQDLIEFCEGTDLVIWDGMFTEEELLSKQGWGHSSIEKAQEFASLSSKVWISIQA